MYEMSGKEVPGRVKLIIDIESIHVSFYQCGASHK